MQGCGKELSYWRQDFSPGLFLPSLYVYYPHPAFGDVFSVIGVREPQPAASEAFVKFADAHRSIEKFGIHLLKTIKPVKTLTIGVKGLEKRGI